MTKDEGRIGRLRAKEVGMVECFANGYALLIGVDENRVAEWALPGAGRDVTALQGSPAWLSRYRYWMAEAADCGPVNEFRVVTLNAFQRVVER